MQNRNDGKTPILGMPGRDIADKIVEQSLPVLSLDLVLQDGEKEVASRFYSGQAALDRDSILRFERTNKVVLDPDFVHAWQKTSLGADCDARAVATRALEGLLLPQGDGMSAVTLVLLDLYKAPLLERLRSHKQALTDAARHALDPLLVSRGLDTTLYTHEDNPDKGLTVFVCAHTVRLAEDGVSLTLRMFFRVYPEASTPKAQAARLMRNVKIRLALSLFPVKASKLLELPQPLLVDIGGSYLQQGEQGAGTEECLYMLSGLFYTDLRHCKAQQADAAWADLEQDFERNSQVILAARREREKFDVYP